jgi:hypothetical protein
MTTGTGEQIDEPAGLRPMAYAVRDLTCGNGAIT